MNTVSFKQVGNLKYRVENNQAVVLGCIKKRMIVKIPKKVTIDNKTFPVTKISSGAFFCNKRIKILIIPDGIYIDSTAFYNSSIRKVFGNPGYVDDHAFSCSPMKNKNIGKTYFVLHDSTCNIPEGVIQIYGMPDIHYNFLRFPSTVKYITGFVNSYIFNLNVHENCTFNSTVEMYSISLDNNSKAICINAKSVYAGNNVEMEKVCCNYLHLGENCTINHLEWAYPGRIPTSTKLYECYLPEVVPHDPKIAYKGFRKGLICRGFQYEFNKQYISEDLLVCDSGFHACYDPLNCLDYYANNGSNEYHPVKILGDVQWNYNKIATNKIEVLPKTLSLEQMINIHNEIYGYC